MAIIELQNQKRSWFLVSAVLALMAIAGFSIYFEVQKTSLQKRLDKLTEQKETRAATSTEISPLDSISNLLKADAQLDVIEKRQLSWSQIIEKIETTIPKVGSTTEPAVNFRAYNGSEEGRFSVNALTRKSAPEPFSDIANVISAFVKEPSFQNVFVPAITKSLTPEGETVLSFSINFDYKKPTF